jgi:hypothetical protein
MNLRCNEGCSPLPTNWTTSISYLVQSTAPPVTSVPIKTRWASVAGGTSVTARVTLQAFGGTSGLRFQRIAGSWRIT